MAKKPELSFSHFGIHVGDMSRMEAFYSGVLGFTVTDRGKLGHTDLVFLSRIPTEHHQIVLASGRPADLGFNTVNQLSFRVPSLGHLRRLHASVSKASGVTDIQPVTHGNAWSVYLRDPEGNRIELYLDTPWYTPQPFRVPIDLSLSNAEIRERTEAECRARPGFMSHRAWKAMVSALMGAGRTKGPAKRKPARRRSKRQ